MNLFEKLGFLPHPEKSVLEPTQIITFLGFVINSVTMTITLTPKKAPKVSMACKKLLAKSECSTVGVTSDRSTGGQFTSCSVWAATLQAS